MAKRQRIAVPPVMNWRCGFACVRPRASRALVFSVIRAKSRLRLLRPRRKAQAHGNWLSMAISDSSCMEGMEQPKDRLGTPGGNPFIARPETFLGLSGSTITRLACWTFGLSVFLAIFTARCLYGDGAHEFVRVLEKGTFVELIWVRGFAWDIIQLFLVLAIKFGVTDPRVLRLPFGVGCFLPWPLAMFLCYRLAPTHFWIVVLACAAGYLNAAFLAVGEHIIAHAFFWPALFALLFVRPLTPFAAAVLLGCALILCRSYESVLFLGPPLAGIAWIRGVRGGKAKWQRLVLFSAVGLL